MRTWARRAVLLVMALLIVAQFIPVGRTNPPMDAAQTISATTPIPPNVASILDRSCQDCHTSQTVWPWYGQVAPVSWLLVNHVNVGRGELNLSDWGHYTARRKDRKLKEICEQVTKGKMPLASYTLLHRQANLSDSDKQVLCTWAEATRKSLAASATTAPGR